MDSVHPTTTNVPQQAFSNNTLHNPQIYTHQYGDGGHFSTIGNTHHPPPPPPPPHTSQPTSNHLHNLPNQNNYSQDLFPAMKNHKANQSQNSSQHNNNNNNNNQGNRSQQSYNDANGSYGNNNNNNHSKQYNNNNNHNNNHNNNRSNNNRDHQHNNNNNNNNSRSYSQHNDNSSSHHQTQIQLLQRQNDELQRQLYRQQQPQRSQNNRQQQPQRSQNNRQQQQHQQQQQEITSVPLYPGLEIDPQMTQQHINRGLGGGKPREIIQLSKDDHYHLQLHHHRTNHHHTTNHQDIIPFPMQYLHQSNNQSRQAMYNQFSLPDVTKDRPVDPFQHPQRRQAIVNNHNNNNNNNMTNPIGYGCLTNNNTHNNHNNHNNNNHSSSKNLSISQTSLSTSSIASSISSQFSQYSLPHSHHNHKNNNHNNHNNHNRNQHNSNDRSNNDNPNQTPLVSINHNLPQTPGFVTAVPATSSTKQQHHQQQQQSNPSQYTQPRHHQQHHQPPPQQQQQQQHPFNPNQWVAEDIINKMKMEGGYDVKVTTMFKRKTLDSALPPPIDHENTNTFNNPSQSLTWLKNHPKFKPQPTFIDGNNVFSTPHGTLAQSEQVARNSRILLFSCQREPFLSIPVPIDQTILSLYAHCHRNDRTVPELDYVIFRRSAKKKLVNGKPPIPVPQPPILSLTMNNGHNNHNADDDMINRSLNTRIPYVPLYPTELNYLDLGVLNSRICPGAPISLDPRGDAGVHIIPAKSLLHPRSRPTLEAFGYKGTTYEDLGACCRLFLGQIPPSQDPLQLYFMLSSFGIVEELVLLKDRETLCNTGAAFCTFSDYAATRRAVADLDGLVRLCGANEPITARLSPRHQRGNDKINLNINFWTGSTRGTMESLALAKMLITNIPPCIHPDTIISMVRRFDPLAHPFMMLPDEDTGMYYAVLIVQKQHVKTLLTTYDNISFLKSPSSSPQPLICELFESTMLVQFVDNKTSKKHQKEKDRQEKEQMLKMLLSASPINSILDIDSLSGIHSNDPSSLSRVSSDGNQSNTGTMKRLMQPMSSLTDIIQAAFNQFRANLGLGNDLVLPPDHPHLAMTAEQLLHINPSFLNQMDPFNQLKRLFERCVNRDANALFLIQKLHSQLILLQQQMQPQNGIPSQRLSIRSEVQQHTRPLPYHLAPMMVHHHHDGNNKNNNNQNNHTFHKNTNTNNHLNATLGLPRLNSASSHHFNLPDLAHVNSYGHSISSQSSHTSGSGYSNQQSHNTSQSNSPAHEMVRHHQQQQHHHHHHHRSTQHTPQSFLSSHSQQTSMHSLPPHLSLNDTNIVSPYYTGLLTTSGLAPPIGAGLEMGFAQPQSHQSYQLQHTHQYDGSLGMTGGNQPPHFTSAHIDYSNAQFKSLSTTSSQTHTPSTSCHTSHNSTPSSLAPTIPTQYDGSLQPYNLSGLTVGLGGLMISPTDTQPPFHFMNPTGTNGCHFTNTNLNPQQQQPITQSHFSLDGLVDGTVIPPTNQYFSFLALQQQNNPPDPNAYPIDTNTTTSFSIPNLDAYSTHKSHQQKEQTPLDMMYDMGAVSSLYLVDKNNDDHLNNYSTQRFVPQTIPEIHQVQNEFDPNPTSPSTSNLLSQHPSLFTNQNPPPPPPLLHTQQHQFDVLAPLQAPREQTQVGETATIPATAPLSSITTFQPFIPNHANK